MPTVDAPPDEMDALIAYLATFGKPAADARSAENTTPVQTRTKPEGEESSLAKVQAVR